MSIRVRYSTKQLMEILSVSERTVKRMKARIGAKGHWVYLSQLRKRMPEVWESMRLIRILDPESIQNSAE